MGRGCADPVHRGGHRWHHDGRRSPLARACRYRTADDGLRLESGSQALDGLIDAARAVERVAGGFNFTEGPFWNRDDEFLLFSDMRDDIRRRWSRAGVEAVMSPSNKGNGMVYDRDGNLLVCEHTTSTLVRER